MTEEYSIGEVKGFQVVSTDGKYYSIVFPTLAEAQAHEKKLLATPKIEQTVTKAVNPPKEKVKDGRK
jgi:hypothetical protein